MQSKLLVITSKPGYLTFVVDLMLRAGKREMPSEVASERGLTRLLLCVTSCANSHMMAPSAFKCAGAKIFKPATMSSAMNDEE